MIQLLLPMPRLPHPHSLHLCRSRHGIWYVRYVVPSDQCPAFFYMLGQKRFGRQGLAARRVEHLAQSSGDIFCGAPLRGLSIKLAKGRASQSNRVNRAVRTCIPTFSAACPSDKPSSRRISVCARSRSRQFSSRKTIHCNLLRASNAHFAAHIDTKKTRPHIILQARKKIRLLQEFN